MSNQFERAKILAPIFVCGHFRISIDPFLQLNQIVSSDFSRSERVVKVITSRFGKRLPVEPRH
jgi:hypothetical protein